MKRIGIGKRWLACVALLGGGCGAIPDIIVDAAWLSAKEALQEAVGDAVDDVIDGTVGELLDLDARELPFDDQSQEEEAFDDDAAESGESDRETRRGFSRSSPLP